MDPNKNLSMDPSNGAGSSAGDHIQQLVYQIMNDNPFRGNRTNAVQVMPCQVQMFAKYDDQGRRYVVLENLPINKNYVANRINSGGEFA